jgi:high-affinity iron transporter
MLPTFVIGLREGLEAALIVGIIAAFLRKQGRRDLLRWVFAGVGTAVLLCLAVGIALNAVSKDLPQKQQEGLETVIGVLAVGMVTYMVVWMRRHSRELKGQLEGLAADALGQGANRAARAMVLMAFLAVLREGFETVVFLLAAFNESGSSGAAGLGAVLGIAVAVILGYGIYRGGVQLNLSKFFRATGLVLVLVAAGLVVNALHTAHEAGWLNSGQGGTVDLTWLVRPGSVQSSLLTGMLGVQPHPVVIEVVGWLLYLVPVGLYVGWPPGRALPRRSLVRVLSVAAAIGAVVALGCALVAPSRPRPDQMTTAGSVTAQLSGARGSTATVRTAAQSPAAASDPTGAVTAIAVHRTGSEQHAGLDTDVYTASLTGRGGVGRPARLSSDQIAALNGGRLPIGVRPDANDTMAVRYRDTSVLTLWVEPRTGRVTDLHWAETVTVEVVGSAVGDVALPHPLATAASALPSAVVTSAVRSARHDADRLDHRGDLDALAWIVGLFSIVAAAGAVGLALSGRRPAAVAPTVRQATARLVKS